MIAKGAGKGSEASARTSARPLRPHDPAKPQGLARWLAKAGYGTRAVTTRMVRTGRVTLSGVVVLDPATPVSPGAVIAVDGKAAQEIALCYLAFHKPTRIVTGERGGRRQVMDLLPPGILGLRPAGRMHAGTAGLLLLSNDPGWNEIAAGASGLEKEYRICLRGRFSDLELGVITAGMTLPGLGYLRPEKIELLVQEQEQTTLRLVTTAGKVRQIRRLFKILHHEVIELTRTRIGPVALRDLPPARWRPLDGNEVETIRAAGVPDRNGS